MRCVPLLALLLTGCASHHTESGVASWYGPGFRGNPTASGERFRPAKRTAAHRTLPFGSVVKVTRVETGETVRVVINDRGPYAGQRVIDLSKKAARRIGMLDAGTATVDLKVVGCRGRYEDCRSRWPGSVGVNTL